MANIAKYARYLWKGVLRPFGKATIQGIIIGETLNLLVDYFGGESDEDPSDPEVKTKWEVSPVELKNFPPLDEADQERFYCISGGTILATRYLASVIQEYGLNYDCELVKKAAGMYISRGDDQSMWCAIILLQSCKKKLAYMSAINVAAKKDQALQQTKTLEQYTNFYQGRVFDYIVVDSYRLWQKREVLASGDNPNKAITIVWGALMDITQTAVNNAVDMYSRGSGVVTNPALKPTLLFSTLMDWSNFITDEEVRSLQAEDIMMTSGRARNVVESVLRILKDVPPELIFDVIESVMKYKFLPPRRESDVILQSGGSLEYYP